MGTVLAPAWRASWFNSWLAAVGATLLVDGMTVRWVEEQGWCAEFHLDEGDPAETLQQALPTEGGAQALAIARLIDGLAELPQQPARENFVERASLARHHGDWSLGAALTDLAPTEDSSVQPSPLNAPAPKGITLGQRVAAVAQAAGSPEQTVTASFDGALRVKGNGLAFDVRRLTSPLDPVGSNWIDPIVELAAFAGMIAVSVSGDGRRRHGRLGPAMNQLTWFTWSVPLDIAGIDDVLDRGPVLGAAVFAAHTYRAANNSDVTRGVGSVRS